MGAMAAAGAAGMQETTLLDAAISRNDAAAERLLAIQVTDPGSPFRGAYPNPDGLHLPHSAGGIIEVLTAAFLQPRSRFHKDAAVLERIRLAAGHLDRTQTRDGNIDLLTTNFNSPPDTGFVVEGVATAAVLARRAGEKAISSAIEPFLRRAGAGMAKGGVHTPNHRWVVCGALAQLHELFGEPDYVRRIDQWLAEGIDLDADGQWTERSTTVYNAVCDRAFIMMADKLKRPALLDAPRRNLASMLYLLHPNGEVVTEISRRQDRNERGDMSRYWFPLLYLAHRDRDGALASLAGRVAPQNATLSLLMAHTDLAEPLPAPAALPDNFEHAFRESRIVRIRRGPVSATVMLQGNSRILALRRGDAVISAVRFAAAFFGKGQFVPAGSSGKWTLSQSLEADYLQPFDPPRKVAPGDWYELRAARRRSEICRLEYTADVAEQRNGFSVRFRAAGTGGVPCAVEINAREGAFEGCTALGKDSWLLERGVARLRAGADEIRFGPGGAAHRYVDIRGGEPRLPGTSVFVTGYTPFDHTISFEW